MNHRYNSFNRCLTPCRHIIIMPSSCIISIRSICVCNTINYHHAVHMCILHNQIHPHSYHVCAIMHQLINHGMSMLCTCICLMHMPQYSVNALILAPTLHLIHQWSYLISYLGPYATIWVVDHPSRMDIRSDHTRNST